LADGLYNLVDFCESYCGLNSSYISSVLTGFSSIALAAGYGNYWLDMLGSAKKELDEINARVYQHKRRAS
jgi:hypothetical protein